MTPIKIIDITKDQFLDYCFGVAPPNSQTLGSSTDFVLTVNCKDMTITRADIESRMRRFSINTHPTLVPAIIRGNLTIEPGAKISSVSCRVEGDFIARDSLLQETSPEFHCGGDMDAGGCHRLQRVGGTVTGTCLLVGSTVQRFYQNFKCFSLDASECQQLDALTGTFAQNVRVDNSSIRSLDDDFICRGSFSACLATGLKEVGGSFGGNVILDGSGARTVRPDFSSKGTLSLKNCQEIDTVEGDIGGDLFLTGSSASKINVTVEGDIHADSCPKLKEIRGRTKGSAIFRGAGVESLGNAFFCSKELDVSFCNSLECLELPVGGNCIASQSALKRTGIEFHVGGDFHALSCGSLQTVLGRVDGECVLNGSSVSSLGQHLRCGNDLHAQGCRDLRYLDCSVEGSAYLYGSGVEDVGPHFSFKTLADLGGTRIQTLKGTWGEGRLLLLRRSSLAKLGADFSFPGSLDLTQCSLLESLNCSAGGNVNVSGSALRRTGPAFSVKGDFICKTMTYPLLLEGEFGGSVVAEGDLTISKTARIAEDLVLIGRSPAPLVRGEISGAVKTGKVADTGRTLGFPSR